MAKKNTVLYLMLIPGILLTFIFNYLPMGGLIIAFQKFKPWLGFTGSPWVGWDNFRLMFEREDSLQVIGNTFAIAGLKMLSNLVVPIVFALLLNEVRQMFFKRAIQTLVYLPHFLSWVILGGILLDMLSSQGLINGMLLPVFGIDRPIQFLGDGNWFRAVVVASDTWKEFGFSTIVFLATLAGINPAWYEAAEVDGASRWKQTLHITLPSMIPIITVVGTLSLGNILNAGFDQIFNLYNPLVYDKGDIIDTFVYRIGVLSGQFGLGTAVGLFKSFVGLVMIVTAYRLAYKLANYRIF
ncbi:ABC transporter permease [Cohnella sp. JJ-181]|uniref:ABC transporter permease n=1 Tax=Cohnella rhizoplanae TaxID=2974897 RepID=UPI0022FF9BE3|nr:ABC transporter permease subunit [Cohnella sp. JJ-181]CAI6048842.1 putative multiple-sugar transport system permease YteP [Cohnella sp. JJ-181]